MSGSVWGILVILLGLAISVGLHELGHLVAAVKFGALVPEYSIGFGPALWRRTLGATQVVLRALPLGGYVRILGMFAPGHPGRQGTRRRGTPTLAEQARAQSAAEIPPGQEDQAFYRLRWWRKAIVMAAGPVVNFVLAFVFLTCAMVGIGVPGPSLTLSDVAPTISTSMGEVTSPAAQAGLQAGDSITAVDGKAVTRWSQFHKEIAHSHGSVEVSFLRQGHERHTRITAVENTNGVRIIGVAAGVEYQRARIDEVVASYGSLTWGTTRAILSLPVAVWDLGHSLIAGEQRDASGLISIVGVGRIAGEVTGDSSRLGLDGGGGQLAVLLSLLASLNIALGAFNLIPLPPLDGGHIAGALVEGVRALVFHVQGRPDPGAVDTARLMPLTYIVGGILFGLTCFLILADIIAPLSLR